MSIEPLPSAKFSDCSVRVITYKLIVKVSQNLMKVGKIWCWLEFRTFCGVFKKTGRAMGRV